MSRICGLKKGQPLSNECQDVALMPYNFVYPIHYPDWRIYFQKSTRNIMQWINGSYAVHVWNKLSHSEPLLIGSDQVYSILASRHCPFTVARAAEYSD
jgi:lactosylceramide 4-alpha-galactosyltransferase